MMTTTVYDYMCDVLKIEACIDCPNFKNWECIGDYSQGDAGCLESLLVTQEDIRNNEHPNQRIFREMQQTAQRMAEGKK